MTSRPIEIRSDELTVAISPWGAEPHSVRDAEGHEYLWQAGAAWKRHAPVLFPVICRVPEDRIWVGNASYPMPQHGFARDSLFQVVDADYGTARFVLVASDETREHYPYDFGLGVSYSVTGNKFTVSFDVENRGDKPMPFSLGWHPAFIWPLESCTRKTLHEIRFDADETGTFRRVEDNLMTPDTFGSVVVDRKVELHQSLFDQGAVIMTDVASTSLVYSANSVHSLQLDWDNFTGITLWSKPDADFLCIEPWRGTPAPADFSGQFIDKPDNSVLQAGQRANFVAAVTLL